MTRKQECCLLSSFHRLLFSASCLLPIFYLLSCQCGRTDLEARLNLSLPPLPDGEVNHYRVRALDDSIGTYTTMIKYDWLQPAKPDEEPLPVYMVVLVTRTRTGNVPVTDSSFLHVRRDNLTPRSSFRFIWTGPALATTAANYGTQSVAVSSFAAGEERRQLFPITAKTYDIDGLVLLGRALKLEPKKPARLTVINPMGPPFGGAMYEAEFHLAGDEQISVPAGVFDCCRLELSMGEEQIDLWYEKAGTRRLVRFVAKGSGITIELLPPSGQMIQSVP